MTLSVQSSPKILVALASYGMGNDCYLAQLVAEYRSMSFHVDIVVLSNLNKKVPPGVETVVVDLKGQNPWSLPFPHKQIFASHLNETMTFLSILEDDTLVSETNLRAFLEMSDAVRENEIPGFLRFEQASGGARNFPRSTATSIGIPVPFE